MHPNKSPSCRSLVPAYIAQHRLQPPKFLHRHSLYTQTQFVHPFDLLASSPSAKTAALHSVAWLTGATCAATFAGIEPIGLLFPFPGEYKLYVDDTCIYVELITPEQPECPSLPLQLLHPSPSPTPVLRHIQATPTLPPRPLHPHPSKPGVTSLNGYKLGHTPSPHRV